LYPANGWYHFYFFYGVRRVQGHIDIIEFLFDNGADINKQMMIAFTLATSLHLQQAI
jgi:hypothetical protein